MKLNDVYKIADRLAPKALSDEMCAKYGFFDNSRVLVNVCEEITGIVFSLDLTDGAIDKAIQSGANLIITHHPAIYGGISSLDREKSLLENKLVRCIRQGISVLSMHLNLDGANGGIDESLMRGVALSAGGKASKISVQLPLQGGGYGRGYNVKEISLTALAENLKRTFASDKVLVYGQEKTIKRVASFCGAGADEKSVAFALQTGADVILSSDFKHHVLSMAIEGGLSVIILTHYASEQYGFEKYYEKIKGEVPLPCVYHLEEGLL